MMKKILVLALLLAAACSGSVAFAGEYPFDTAIMSAIQKRMDRSESLLYSGGVSITDGIIDDNLKDIQALEDLRSALQVIIDTPRDAGVPLRTPKTDAINLIRSNIQRLEAEIRTAFRIAKIVHPGVPSSVAAPYLEELRYTKMRVGNINASFEKDGAIGGFVYFLDKATLRASTSTLGNLKETLFRDIIIDVLFDRAVNIGKELFGTERMSSDNSSSSRTTWQLKDKVSYHLTVRKATWNDQLVKMVQEDATTEDRKTPAPTSEGTGEVRERIQKRPAPKRTVTVFEHGGIIIMCDM